MVKLTDTSTPDMFSLRVLVDTEDSRAAQSAAKAVEDATAIAAELQEALQKSRQEQVAASEDAQERERDLEESLRKSEKVGYVPRRL